MKKYLLTDKDGEVIRSFYFSEGQLERLLEKIDDLESYEEEIIEDEEYTENEDYKRLMKGRG
jgi:hypothetical protein